MEKKNLLPMNLQFFADEEGAPENPTPSENANPETPDEQEATPDTKALNEQLQSALVEIARLKRQVDKSSSEAAEYKKKFREQLSEQEQASLAKAEEQAKHEEEFENLKKQVRVNELTENFMDLGYSKDLARKAAIAQADSDTQTLLDIQKQFQTQQRKEWEADFLKSRPEINAGTGAAPTITKEQFDNMTLIEKTKLKRENEQEYKRLLAL